MSLLKACSGLSSGALKLPDEPGQAIRVQAFLDVPHSPSFSCVAWRSSSRPTSMMVTNIRTGLSNTGNHGPPLRLDSGRHSPGERLSAGFACAASPQSQESGGSRPATSEQLQKQDAAAGTEEDGVEEEEDDEEFEDGEDMVELTDEELALSADIEAQLKEVLEAREGEGAEIEGGIPWRFAEEGELEDDEEEEEDTEPGDGLDGGGVVLGGASWGPQILAMAEGVLGDPKFSGEGLEIFGLRVYPERRIVRIRLDKLTHMWGSPAIEELEAYLQELYAMVQAAEERQDLPADIEIEVSTPGAERVVFVPKDLDRFSHSPMYVCYNEASEDGVQPKIIRHEVFDLVEVDLQGEAVVWKLADVRVNREMMGKGRRLNKKQRETRIRVPFTDINVVRLYLDV